MIHKLFSRHCVAQSSDHRKKADAEPTNIPIIEQIRIHLIKYKNKGICSIEVVNCLKELFHKAIIRYHAS